MPYSLGILGPLIATSASAVTSTPAVAASPTVPCSGIARTAGMIRAAGMVAVVAAAKKIAATVVAGISTAVRSAAVARPSPIALTALNSRDQDGDQRGPADPDDEGR